MLAPGFHDVPAGHVAAVVTHLEMPVADATDRPLPTGVTLRPERAPALDWYRDLFTRVGAVDWLWFSRLQMSDTELAQILHDPDVEVFGLMQDGKDEGLLEMDFRPGDGTCELAFLGLTKAAQGGGLGAAMIGHGAARARARGVRTMTVHTCTFDSPWALTFYMRCGFKPERREIEIVPDPRLGGPLPSDAAPHHPVILA